VIAEAWLRVILEAWFEQEDAMEISVSCECSDTM
jgi:hypothetical protein